MANILTSNLRSRSSNPFTDVENFMSKIFDNELASLTGGAIRVSTPNFNESMYVPTSVEIGDIKITIGSQKYY